MYVFIDESGDPGFKVSKGSSPVFVAAMVIFNDAVAAQETRNVIDSSPAKFINRGEFKFQKCDDNVRDLFFESVKNCRFRIRSIVVKKSIIYSPRLRTNKDTFYEYFVKSMLQHDGGVIKNATIIIDGSGDRNYRKELQAAIKRRMPNGALKKLKFSDSRNDSLIQLSDMCAGAIARSYRTDRAEPTRWRCAIEHLIDDVWDFR